jgi:intracellular multiplication protein IcmL
MNQVENKISNDEALVLIYSRNEFYKNKYYFALSIYLLSLVVIAILAGMVVYLVKHPTEPLYFPTDDVGRLIREVPVTVPNMSAEDVTAWTVEAVEHAHSYDFMNYRGELQAAQKYFSDYGWQKYMDGLKISNNLVALNQRKMIFIAKVVDKPKLLREGIVAGAYGYKFEIPLLVTYLLPPYDEKSRFQNPLKVTVIVQRQKILESYKGLGILQMIDEIATTPNTGDLMGTAPQ